MNPDDLAAIRARDAADADITSREAVDNWFVQLRIDVRTLLAEVDRLNHLWLTGLRVGRAGARGELRARMADIPDVPVCLDGRPIMTTTGVIARADVMEALDGFPVWVDGESA